MDEAVRRVGRFDEKVFVGVPSESVGRAVA
jgi:SpoVK/Ycf46/Vps4 family AAA+-type ATPase